MPWPTHVNDNTVLVVGSAPQYPQGVIDPIAEIAALAETVGASCHVDACMGGFVLPFAERLGRAIDPWDFRVPGVTTISADIHKLGYAPKGVSVILHRTKELRRYQTFVFDDWLGGFYASPNLQGTRSGLPMACAWAVMSHLGVDGYVALTAPDPRQRRSHPRRHRRHRRCVRARRRRSAPHRPGRRPGGIRANPSTSSRSAMRCAARGWYLDRQGPPDSLHSTVSNSNTGVIDEYLTALDESVAEVRGETALDRSTTYATLD